MQWKVWRDPVEFEHSFIHLNETIWVRGLASSWWSSQIGIIAAVTLVFVCSLNNYPPGIRSVEISKADFGIEAGANSDLVLKGKNWVSQLRLFYVMMLRLHSHSLYRYPPFVLKWRFLFLRNWFVGVSFIPSLQCTNELKASPSTRVLSHCCPRYRTLLKCL